MQPVWIIAKHNVKMFFRSPLFVMMLVAPIVVNLFCSYMFSPKAQSIMGKVVVWSPEESPSRDLLIDQLGKRNLEVRKATSEAELEKLITERKSDLGIIIQEGGLEVGLVGGSPLAELVSATQSPQVDYAKEQVKVVLGILGGLGGQNSQPNSSLGESLEKALSHQTQVVSLSEQNNTAALMTSFGIFVMLFLFTCIKSLEPLVKERANTVYDRIGMSPVKHYEYLLGHVLGCFGILMIQAVIQVIGTKLIQIDFAVNSLQLLLICMVLAMIGVAIGLFIHNFTKDAQMYFVVATFVITPLCMLSNCIFPIALLPEVIGKASYLSPIRWLMASYEQMIQGGDLVAVGGPLLIAMMVAVVIFLLGIWWNQYKEKSWS